MDPRAWGPGLVCVGGLAGPGGDLLFRALRRSTIGAEGFHGRVRDGIGCFAPRYGHQAVQAFPLLKVRSELCVSSSRVAALSSCDSCRWMRTLKPIERLVPVSCADCSASTSGLSTWWSTTALSETWF